MMIDLSDRNSKEESLDALIGKEQSLSAKARQLRTRIKLQGANPNPAWKKDLKVAQEELESIQKRMLNYF